ncbi:MAG: hypothetical protein KAH48_11210 [Chlorobi bacterium]|nr:hypothetical protein [Chlorobiota bacterium]
MKKFGFITLFIVLSLNSINMFAGKPGTDKNHFGIYGGVNFNYHNADFQQLEGIPSCCPSYLNGSGIAASGGILFEIPITTSWKYGIRLGYNILSADFLRSESTQIVGNGIDLNSRIDYTLDATISASGIENTVIFKASRNFSLSAGARIDYVLSSKFAQAETIADPNGLFSDSGSVTRNVYSGKIPDANQFYVSAVIRMSYDIELNKRISIVPELTYSVSFTDVAKDIDWRANSVIIGVALKWSM